MSVKIVTATTFFLCWNTAYKTTKNMSTDSQNVYNIANNEARIGNHA